MKDQVMIRKLEMLRYVERYWQHGLTNFGIIDDTWWALHLENHITSLCYCIYTICSLGHFLTKVAINHRAREL